MRRKFRTLWIILVLVLLLPGCEKGSVQVRGLVTEVRTGADGSLTGFLVRTADGGQTGILLTQGTSAFPTGTGPWTDEEMRLEFQEELQVDIKIYADCAPDKKLLAAEDGREFTAYEAAYIRIDGKLERGAVTLRDGAVLDVLVEDSLYTDRTYCLPDGAELLRVRGPSGPEGRYVGGLESFDDLSETAKKKISAFYAAQGALYDEEEQLEAAYAAWKEKGTDFRSRIVEQDVFPSASSERMIYFRTDVTLPLDHGDSCTGYSVSLGAAFDRETGESLSLWDLFRCPEEEARRAIIDAALDWRGSGAVREEMEAAFTPERVVVNMDHLSMGYEPGSMPSQKHGYYFSARIDAVSDLMWPWAVPLEQN